MVACGPRHADHHRSAHLIRPAVRPYVARKGTSTEAIRSRFLARESINEIADDFDLTEQEVEAALRFELGRQRIRPRTRKADDCLARGLRLRPASTRGGVHAQIAIKPSQGRRAGASVDPPNGHKSSSATALPSLAGPADAPCDRTWGGARHHGPSADCVSIDKATSTARQHRRSTRTPCPLRSPPGSA